MKECLIIPCSERKIVYENPMPAIEVFDGVLARVIRKRNPGLPVFIMSWKYGIIPQDEKIENYEISPDGVLCREFVIEKVAKKWIALHDGAPDKFDIIWHCTRGSSFQAIRILERWSKLQHVVADDVEYRHNIGVILRELKAFCVARPSYSDIDLGHLMEMYNTAKSEGKVP